nr:integrase, catalytic core [Tanacetum cinerariifolium]
MVKTQFEKGIKRIRCDNGREFISNSMNEFYKERGIVLETTCPHTPQQNGVVERKHRHLLEIARALQFEASLPTTFWRECILMATYIVNRLPSKRINDKTSYEVLFEQKPEYDHMRVFGCMAYYKNTETNGDKFEPRGKLGVFLGYPSGIKGYKIYDLEERKMVMTRDARFVKEIFPFSKAEPKVFEQEIFEYSSPIPQCDEPHEELAKKMETERSSIQDNEEEQTHSMEDALEDQLEESIDERENDIHAENIHMENHVEPPVIQQEIEEGRPKRHRMQPRHFSEYQGKKAIDSKWVYKIKFKPNGEVERNKARLVAKGCTRREGVDYHDTFAPVAKLVTLRTILAIAVKQRWEIQQLDVNNAFLHEDLEEEVYTKIPQGFSAKDETRVCKLKRNDEKWIKRTKSHLDKEFIIKDLVPLKYFLGIEVAKTSEGLVLSQYKYTLDILQDSGLQGCHPSSFPMEPNLKPDKGEEEEKIDASRYRRLVGRLLYLQVTRPDIAYSVSILSQFVGDPRRIHMEAANRVLRYLKTTIGQGILLPNTTVTDLVAYCDADWLGCPLSRRSRSGYVLLLGGAPISWKSKKQSVVSRSSAEAEYRSMATAVSEIMWVHWLLKEIDVVVVGPTPLFCDNQSAKHIANNLVFHERTKHVEMDCYFVRERVERKEIMPVHINSKKQIADLLTKPLGSHLLQTDGSIRFYPYADPTKVRICERQIEEGQVSLLESTEGRVIPFADDRREIVFQDEEVNNVVDEELQATAANKPEGKKKRRRVVGANASDYPLKKSREDEGQCYGSGNYAICCFTLTLEHEGGGNTDSISGPNLHTHRPSERFVISSESSHHSSRNAADAEVTSLVRSPVPPPPVMTTAVFTTAIAGATSAQVLGEGTEPVHHSRFVDSASAGPEVCRSMIDQLAPPRLFSQLRSMDYDQLFAEFNVEAARQMCLSSEVRLRYEHNFRERKKFERKCNRQVDLLKEKDAEIACLKAQLSLKEAEATEAIRLRSQANFLLLRLRKPLKLASWIVRIRRIFLDGYDVLDVRTPHFWGTVTKCQDMNFSRNSVKHSRMNRSSHGLRLAFMKCLQSPKYVTALATVIGLAIGKAMQTGLVAGVDHGKAGRGLANISAYDPSMKAKYISVVLALRGLDFNLLSQMESQKDTSIADIISLVHLDDPSAKTPEVSRLQPSYEQLLLPIYQKEDNVVTEETSLFDSLDVVHARVQKVKEGALSRRSSISDVVGVLVDQLSSANLLGEASTSRVPTTAATTTALSVPATTTNVSSVLPISVVDYGVLEVGPHNEFPLSPNIVFEKEDLETSLEHPSASPSFSSSFAWLTSLFRYTRSPGLKLVLRTLETGDSLILGFIVGHIEPESKSVVNYVPSESVSIILALEPSIQDDLFVNNVHGSGSSSLTSIGTTKESSSSRSTIKSAMIFPLIDTLHADEIYWHFFASFLVIKTALTDSFAAARNFGEGRLRTASALSGQTFIPLVFTMYPKNTPSSNLKPAVIMNFLYDAGFHKSFDFLLYCLVSFWCFASFLMPDWGTPFTNVQLVFRYVPRNPSDPPSTYMRCIKCPPISASIINGPSVLSSSLKGGNEISGSREKLCVTLFLAILCQVWTIKISKALSLPDASPFFAAFGVHAVHMIKCVWFEVELQGAQENHEVEVHHGANVGAFIMKTEVPGQEGAEGNVVERYRGDSNMAALGVARVIEEYAHESLTFRNAFACEVISKWISVMKEDMDTRFSMYYIGFTCKSKAEIWVTKCLLVEAKEVILGLEIFRAQSGNTLRVSRFWFFNRMSVHILLGGHSTLSLEGDLSVNRDEEKKSGPQSEVPALVEAAAYPRRLTIITKVEIVRILVCNS